MKSNLTVAREAQRARAVERVGDGSAVSLDQFKNWGIAERKQLHSVNVDKYRELAKQETDR